MKLVLLLVGSVGWIAGAAGALAGEPFEIGHTPQFFLDDALVDNRWSFKAKREEVLRVFHAPKKHELNPLIPEGAGYASVARDPESGQFKLWYQTHEWRAGGEEGSEYAIAYAESSDGLKWKLPEFNLHEWKGTRTNNIVWKGKGAKRASGQQVIEVPEKDRRGYRYIMAYRTSGVREQSGIRVVGSQDGIHWDEPNDALVARLGSDTVNSIVYDEAAGEYVMFCRAKDRYLVGGRTDIVVDGESRRVSRMSGKDLWQAWEVNPVSILIPDELDMQRGFNRFYGMSAKRHAGITWGFVWPFKLNTDIVTELTWSRDGWNWQRFPTRPRLIDLGAEGAWDDGMVFGSADWQEVGDEWWLYYAGHDGPHETRERKAGIGVATVRKEGFISMHGPAGGGAICTKLIRWPGGTLVVNVDTNGDADVSAKGNEKAGAGVVLGEMRVRVCDEKRKALPGFGYEDGEAFTGDSTEHEVLWKGRSMDELKGRVVRLEFQLRDADLFTFRARALNADG